MYKFRVLSQHFVRLTFRR